MPDGVLLKLAVWNAERLQLARDIRRAIGPDIAFMPILADDAVTEPAFIDRTQSALSAPAAELVHWYRDASKPVTTDGGPLLSPLSRAAASAMMRICGSTPIRSPIARRAWWPAGAATIWHSRPEARRMSGGSSSSAA